MAPKSRKAGGERGKGAEDKREEPLQAVILTDPFETRFSPFTLERPRCLLPLANTPLIEYTLEFLANAGVEEVFVYCGAHTDQVEAYINASKWSTHDAKNKSPFLDLTIIHSTATTIGAAMRDLDDRAILANDFIVVYGDVVSNLPLDSALAAHKARKAADKNSIMTIVLREVDRDHRTNVHGYTPVFVLDPKKNRCLHYEQIIPGENKSRITIDYAEILKTHGEVDIRTDLIDCGIDILTPESLALWKDNFDLESPRRQYLFKVLEDYELNGKLIHLHIIEDHYAARVRNLHAYDAVSKDIVSRWSYPLCPDANLLDGQSYKMVKGYIYKEQGVILARSCVIGKRSVIGEGTSIGDGTVITDSIIGRECIIGKNVRIEGAYVWDNVTIGDGAVITQSIVANEAVVGKKCVIEAGALLSYGTQISDGTTIPGSRRITKVSHVRTTIIENDIERNVDTVGSRPSDPSVVGPHGEGADYVPAVDSLDENDQLASVGLVYFNPFANRSAESISTLNSTTSTDLTDATGTPLTRSAASSFSAGADDGLLTPKEPQQGHRFHAEAVDSIYDSIAKGENVDNIQIELQALRLGTNASEHQVRKALVLGFMKRISQLAEAPGAKVQTAVANVLGPYGNMVQRAIDDVVESAKTANQVDLLLLFQEECVKSGRGEDLLLFTVKKLVDDDLVEADAVEAWWGSEKSQKGAEMLAVRGKTKQLVEFLLESSEEEEEDDEDEDED